MSHVSSNASDEDHSIKPDDDFRLEAVELNYQQQEEKRRQDYVPQEVTVSQLFHLQSVCCFVVIWILLYMHIYIYIDHNV